ncbi:MAG: SH3 domain-containing protein [Rivularia sp. (in: cyanobacteria)]
MKFLVILFFYFGILLILFGISIFTPVKSWVGKRFNSSKSSYYNYKQPESIRATNLFMGICFFVFGIFITVASATLLHTWNTAENQYSSQTKSVTPESSRFVDPIIPRNISTPSTPSTPPIKNENNSFGSKYRLDCPPNASGLNMRREASLDAQIITLIPCNAILIKDTEQRNYQDRVEWFLVKYKDNIGWVAGKYLKQQANNPKKTTFFTKLIAKKRP